ncbi:hypothetical protein DL93DRAFT_2234319 [Clavulina sp. PMI_390]|nr:hypothetical protein DL93DRAFT_2234319 [Clavulina sp. PMI_390]
MDENGVSARSECLDRVPDVVQALQPHEASLSVQESTLSPLTQSCTLLEPLSDDVKHQNELVDKLAISALQEQDDSQPTAALIHNSSQPILRIPVEITSYILELVAAFSDPPEAARLPDDMYLPISLSFIFINLACQTLRDIAINTPACWSNVIIWFAKRHSFPPTVVELYLLRSKGVLFNFILFVNRPSLESTRLQKLLTLLSTHIHRCRRIEIWSGLEAMEVNEISKVIRDSCWAYPSLRSVKLADYTRDTEREVDEFQLIPFWDQQNTSIESIDLDFGDHKAFKPPSTVEGLYLPAGIRYLRIYEGLHKDLVISAIRYCSYLEHFDWSCQSAELSLDLKPLELPHLKTFKLNEEALSGGFPPIIAPSCEELCLGGLWYSADNDWFLESAQGVVRRFPALKRLSFVHIDGWPTKVQKFLSYHPFIEEILIQGPDPSDGTMVDKERELFDGLAASPTSSLPNSNNLPDLLPSLRLLWYRTTIRLWADTPSSEFVGPSATIAQGLRRLLTQRPALCIKILQEYKEEDIPHELIRLIHDFGSRLFILHNETPDWAI